MTEDMKPTTPETVQPQQTEHLAPALDLAISNELAEKPSIMKDEVNAEGDVK